MSQLAKYIYQIYITIRTCWISVSSTLAGYLVKYVKMFYSQARYVFVVQYHVSILYARVFFTSTRLQTLSAD